MSVKLIILWVVGAVFTGATIGAWTTFTPLEKGLMVVISLGLLGTAIAKTNQFRNRRED